MNDYMNADDRNGLSERSARRREINYLIKEAFEIYYGEDVCQPILKPYLMTTPREYIKDEIRDINSIKLIFSQLELQTQGRINEAEIIGTRKFQIPISLINRLHQDKALVRSDQVIRRQFETILTKININKYYSIFLLFKHFFELYEYQVIFYGHLFDGLVINRTATANPIGGVLGAAVGGTIGAAVGGTIGGMYGLFFDTKKTSEAYELTVREIGYHFRKIRETINHIINGRLDEFLKFIKEAKTASEQSIKSLNDFVRYDSYNRQSTFSSSVGITSSSSSPLNQDIKTNERPTILSLERIQEILISQIRTTIDECDKLIKSLQKRELEARKRYFNPEDKARHGGRRI